MAQQKSMTLVINHLLGPQHNQRYEEWLGKIMPTAAESPGHLDASVIWPATEQNLRSVMVRFDTLEHLYVQTQSEARRQLAVGIAPLLTGGDRVEVRTKPTFWFTPPAANARQPWRQKQFLITLLVIFPNTNLVPTVIGILLPSFKGSLLLHLIDDACMVALVVWFWMPIATCLLTGQLKRN